MVAFVGGVIGPLGQKLLEKFRIDDAVGAVSVHGFCGVWGLLAVGIFMGGYPSHDPSTTPEITFGGQFMGMIVMLLLGFIPGYVISLIMRMMGILRASDGVQEAGMDVEIANDAYPEQIKTH